MISQDEIKLLLLKNKERLARELKNNKKLVELLTKSTYSKLSENEKEKVRYQLGEVIRSIPALAIFLLPGGLILLPIVAKLIPDILPNAFRNEEEE